MYHLVFFQFKTELRVSSILLYFIVPLCSGVGVAAGGYTMNLRISPFFLFIFLIFFLYKQNMDFLRTLCRVLIYSNEKLNNDDDSSLIRNQFVYE